MESKQNTPKKQTDVINEAVGPLEDIRVIELGQLIAGPFAGRIMADFGAEVIKVESPGVGDACREWGNHRYRDRTLWWPVMGRNKKCITLNLRLALGQELVRDLVTKSDVLIENFRPGTMESWGLGPEDLLSVNPRLIITRVSGYGQTGPYAKRAGFASVGEAMGGLRYINGYPGEKPPRMGISLGDSLAAIYVILGTLMALYWRDAGGGDRGQVIDTSIMESCFSLLESAVPEYDKCGAIREPTGSGLPNVAPSNLYRSRDGKWMVIAANIDSLFHRLCLVMNKPELIDDPRFMTHQARGEHAIELDAIISIWAAQYDAADIDQMLNEAGIVCGPIYTIADIFNDPHYIAREMIVRMIDSELGELAVPGLIPKLSETPGQMNWTGPTDLGSHNWEVFGGLLKLSQAELDELESEGVI